MCAAISICDSLLAAARRVHHDGRVKEFARAVAQLNYIADLCVERVDYFGERSDALVARQKFVQKLHARPGRRAVVRRYVKPPEYGRIVHDAAARVHALRREVCAVAADIVEIVVCGVAPVRPFSRVRRSRRAVVFIYVHAIGIFAVPPRGAYKRRAGAVIFAQKNYRKNFPKSIDKRLNRV